MLCLGGDTAHQQDRAAGECLLLFRNRSMHLKSPFTGARHELSHLLSSGFYTTRAVPQWSYTALRDVLGRGNAAPTHHVRGL